MPTFGYTPGGNAYPLNSSAYDQSEFWRLVALGRDVIDQQTKVDSIAAAEQKVEEEISGQGVLRTRGQIPSEITALSQLNHADYNGIWQVNTQHALSDAPFEITQATLVEVLIGSPTNAAKQVVTSFHESWWREANVGGSGTVSSWSPWRKHADLDDITDQVSNAVSTAIRARGDLPDGSNLDDMNNLTDSGVWRILSLNTYPGLPFSLSGAGVLKIESTANRTAVMQTVSDINRSMWRVTNTASSWGQWHSSSGGGVDSVAHAIVATNAASNWTATTRYFDKNADTLDRPASTMKLLTLYTALQTVNTAAQLDTLVTVTSADIANNPGGSGGITFQQGDQISYRDLMYAMMLPSSNWASEILARAVGEQLSGTGTGREKFLQAMRDIGTGFGWTGHVIDNPSGLGTTNRLSAAMLVQLMLAGPGSSANHRQFAAALERTITFQGPNARTQTVRHTVDPDGDVKFPDFAAAKTGTLTAGDHRCLVMLWSKPGGGYAASALLGSDTANRFKDMRTLINATISSINTQNSIRPGARYISAPTDFDTYRTASHVGAYVIRSDDMVGGPPIQGNPLLTVEVLQGVSNGVMQRVTSQYESWWRSAASSVAWGEWRRLAVSGELSRGTLPNGTDFDSLWPTETHGTYHIAGTNNATYPNNPAPSAIATVLNVYGGNQLNSVIQTHTVIASNRPLEQHVRKLVVVNDGVPQWSVWVRMARADELSNTDGSGIEWDDDDVPYVAEGAGENPQPAWRRLVSESRLSDVLPTVTVESSTVRRIRISTNPDEPLDDGDLLLVIGD